MVISDELRKLCSEGYGVLIAKEEMIDDRVLPKNQCFTVFLKNEITHIDDKFFSMVKDSDLTKETYERNFCKDIESTMKKIVAKYHPQKDSIVFSQDSNPSISMK